ncbi:MAG: hypothetical protein SPI30_03930 [Prevotella sp.]|nr:hypothetical protein [Prevotella sp.]
MSSRLSSAFAKGVAGYAKEKIGEDDDKQAKAVRQQQHRRGTLHWRSNDRFGFKGKRSWDINQFHNRTRSVIERVPQFPAIFPFVKVLADNNRFLYTQVVKDFYKFHVERLV